MSLRVCELCPRVCLWDGAKTPKTYPLTESSDGGRARKRKGVAGVMDLEGLDRGDGDDGGGPNLVAILHHAQLPNHLYTHK